MIFGPRSVLLLDGADHMRDRKAMLPAFHGERMQAYGDLPAALRHRCPLVLVGGWGWNAAELGQHYHDEAHHRGVHLVGSVPEAELPAVYNGARALVFPSHYEGFGLPPLEMLARPMVTAGLMDRSF